MRTLITFAREPIAGRTKTRLCPPLDGATAAGLYTCFLRDVLDNMRRVPDVRRVVAYTPDSNAAFFADLAADFAAWPQCGAGLGERMHNALTKALGGPHPLTPSPAAAGEGEKRSPPLPSQAGLGERMDNALTKALGGPHPLTPSPAAAGEGGKRSPPLPSQAGLGERMDNALTKALGGPHPLTPSPAAAGEGGKRSPPLPSQWERGPGGEGHSAVIIGSDSPDLPSEYICEAFTRLERGADVVLGPADDGGYYLIGLRVPQPRLLREVPMSTPTVLADTLALVCELGLRVDLLPAWYDIDTVAELRRLAATSRAAPPDVAAYTRAFLSDSRFEL